MQTNQHALYLLCHGLVSAASPNYKTNEQFGMRFNILLNVKHSKFRISSSWDKICGKWGHFLGRPNFTIKADTTYSDVCIWLTMCILAKKVNERAQTTNFSVLIRGRWWRPGALCKKRGKGKLKCILLKIWNWYDLSRVGPCERVRSQLWHIVV